MLKINWWTLISMIFIVIGSVHSQTCNSTAILTDVYACIQQYGDLTQFGYLHTVCGDVECYLQCVSNAVGNCHINDEFVLYNIPKEIVIVRAACSNLTFFNGLLNNYCSLFNYTCWKEQNITGLVLELAAKNATANLTKYKDAFCQFNTAGLTCIDVQPNNDNCTTAMIDFLKDYYNTSYSYEECGQSETHPYFTTYSGALNCTATNSSNQTTPNNTTSAPNSSTMESSSQSSTMSDSTSSSAQGPNQKCSWLQIEYNLGSCYNILADQFSPSYKEILTSFCESVECHIQCYTDAVGDCYLEDKAFFFDPVVYKVVMRAYCNNITATINAFTLCVMDDTTCIQTYLSSLSSIQTLAQTSNDYATFAYDYCSASSTYDSCVTFTPDETCTSSYASLMKHTQTVSVSYEKCSQQNHGYFFTYGSEVACGGCSITPHFLLLFVAILSFLQFNN